MHSAYFPGCDCMAKFLVFLSRAMHPVLKRLYLSGTEVPPKLSTLVASANAHALVSDVRSFLCDGSWRAPLIEALRDGTFRPQSLELSQFYNFNHDETPLVGRFLSKLLTALSSRECALKELHMKQFTMIEIASDLERYLLDMLQKNKSLRVLGIYSDVGQLQFPPMAILSAAAKHPRLRTICFYPPIDPPGTKLAEPFQLWMKKNRSIDIQFKDFNESAKKAHLSKWLKAVFAIATKEFNSLKQIQDEKTRSYLLVMALATCHQMPDRMYYLLCGNQDVFARGT
ncbi:hypothetical protein FisN_9Lu131 [Fistulifera solaris]|uniref:Uncharacterized protein n=1 Tax=Fistulifera solaris TaxID=1519565 RepID=A0A1Z5KKK3_FISSO|nr:hypothetical protein FisN_9Lu131 [Fistulifera solaris]|eukprot:GAX26850.1 hypothetical protein FisN_9Lu131 [Fistulifera solaris]